MARRENQSGFRECDACAAKPGSPPLCEPCIHNRNLVDELREAIVNERSWALAMCALAMARAARPRVDCVEGKPSKPYQDGQYDMAADLHRTIRGMSREEAG